jgi:hypothetical protein
MIILDAILAIALTVGCVLSLRIGWWLFVTPLVRFARWCPTRKRDERQPVQSTPARAVSLFSTTTNPARTMETKPRKPKSGIRRIRVTVALLRRHIRNAWRGENYPAWRMYVPHPPPTHMPKREP